MATVISRGSTIIGTSGTTWASTSNAIDGTTGTNPATYATWTNAVALASGYIDIGGYGFDTTLNAGDVVTQISVANRHQESQTARFSGVVVEPFVGSTSIATAQLSVLSTTARTDTHNFTGAGITTANIRDANFKIRIRADRLGGTISSIFYLDQADVTVTYTPAEGKPYVHVGGSFTKKPLLVHNGSTFVQKPVYVHTGTEWKKLT